MAKSEFKLKIYILLKENRTNERVLQWGPGAGPAHSGCLGQLGSSCGENLPLPSLSIVSSQKPHCHLWGPSSPRAGGVLGPGDLTHSRSLALTRTYHISGFTGGSDGKEFTFNTGEPGSIPGLGRSIGEGNRNPLQYSCLENSMDRGAWRAIVHSVTKNRT